MHKPVPTKSPPVLSRPYLICPVRMTQTLATAPLIAGSGEFGGGAAPGIWFNVVQNAYAAGALLAMASLEKDANDSAQQAHYTEAATTLRSNMLQHLVNSTDGSWYCEPVTPPAAFGCVAQAATSNAIYPFEYDTINTLANARLSQGVSTLPRCCPRRPC